MLKCVTDVLPTAGRSYEGEAGQEGAAASPVYPCGVTGVCQRQTSLTQTHFCNSYNAQWKRKNAELLRKLRFMLPFEHFA